jgi:hypothetical protein
MMNTLVQPSKTLHATTRSKLSRYCKQSIASFETGVHISYQLKHRTKKPGIINGAEFSHMVLENVELTMDLFDCTLEGLDEVVPYSGDMQLKAFSTISITSRLIPVNGGIWMTLFLVAIDGAHSLSRLYWFFRVNRKDVMAILGGAKWEEHVQIERA